MPTPAGTMVSSRPHSATAICGCLMPVAPVQWPVVVNVRQTRCRITSLTFLGLDLAISSRRPHISKPSSISDKMSGAVLEQAESSRGGRIIT